MATIWTTPALPIDAHAENETEQENYTSDNDIECSVVLRCPYAYRHDVADNIISNRLEWPRFPAGVTNKPRAYSVSISPAGCLATELTTGRNHYADALLSVSYTTKTEITDLIVESLEPTAEFIKQGYSQFRWKGDGLPLSEGEAPAKLVTGLILNRSLKRVPIPAGGFPSYLLSYAGHVNNAQYVSTLTGLTFAADTLLYVPPRFHRTIRSNGNVVVNMDFAYEYKAEGWNKFFRNDTGLFDQIVDKDGNDVNSYPQSNFNQAYLLI